MKLMLCKAIKEQGLKDLDLSKFCMQEKLDGQRVIFNKDLISRRDVILNDKFKHIYNELKGLNQILDGEIVFLKDGISDFHGLSLKENQDKAIFIVFDILSLDGKTFTSLVYESRLILLKILSSYNTFKHIKMIKTFPVNKKLIAKWKAEGREGLVLKKLDSRYVFKRSDSWLKLKFLKEGKFKIIGHEKGTEHGAFLLENGGKVSACSRENVLTYEQMAKQGSVFADVDFLNETITGKLFQPVLKRLVR